MAKTPKSDEPCYTKKSKNGKAYTTCEGAQKKRAKQRAGKKLSKEENAQKAGLKVQKLQIKRNAKRPIKGRIETGPLNPGKITSVSFPKAKAKPKERIIDVSFNEKKDQDKDKELPISKVGEYINKIKPEYSITAKDIPAKATAIFITGGEYGELSFHDIEGEHVLTTDGKRAIYPSAPKETGTYIQRAKKVFESHKKYFRKNHFAQVQIQGMRAETLNWDGYNLYEKELFSSGKKIGTYKNEKDLEIWRDYGIASAFTKYDPLELKSGAKGLKLN